MPAPASGMTLWIKANDEQAEEVSSTRPDYVYAPLVSGDDFDYEPDVQGKVALNPVWQWNHEPDFRGISFSGRPGHLRIRTLDVCDDAVKARNSLTQRTIGPRCAGILKVDAGGIQEGDYAGLSAFQSNYAFIGVTKENGKYYVAMLTKEELHKEEIDTPEIQLKVVCDFEGSIDIAKCFYLREDNEPTESKLSIGGGPRTTEKLAERVSCGYKNGEWVQLGSHRWEL